VSPGHDFDEQAALTRCRMALARFKVPRRLVAIDSFPVSEGSNGNKIQRKKLRERAMQVLSEVTAT
jgi:fatty-acyl-CoA synthase